MKKIFLVILLFFLSFVLWENTHEDSSFLRADSDKEYVLGVMRGDYLSEYILTDLAHRSLINYKVEYIDDFSLLMAGLENGSIDFASGLTYTTDRGLFLDYTVSVDIEEVYLYSKDKYLINDFPSGMTIGVLKDSVYENLVQNYFTDATIVYYQSATEFLTQLNNGVVNCTISNYIPLEETQKQGYYALPLNNEILIKPVSVVTKKDTNTDVLSQFSTIIKTKDFQEQLAEYKHTQKQAIIQRVLELKLNEYFAGQPLEITIKLENNSPFSFYDSKENNYTGIFADTLKQVCEKLDASCTIQSKLDETWDSMYQDLLNNSIDVLAPVTVTKDREPLLYFSDKVLTSDYVIVNREDETQYFSDVSQLLHQKIGTVTNDAKAHYLEQLFYTNSSENHQLIYYDSNDAVLNALSNGDVDYALMNKVTFYDYIKRHLDSNLVVNKNIGVVFSENISFAFQKTQKGQQLKELFDIALMNVDTTGITQRYMIGGNPVYYYKEEIRAQRLYSILLIGVASVLTIGLGSLILYGRRLKEKTYKDSLTTLYNRFYFSDKLETILHKFKQPIAYVVADINGLNFINNSFGHRMGDEVIITVASILKDVFSNGVIIRMGGDEFLIICDQIDGATVEDKMETVYHICEQTKRFPISLSISLGYKISFDKEERFEQIFDLAENQMYQEKFNKSQSRRSDFIQTILTTLHEKDSYSEAHSTNVALYSERFAKVLGLKHEEVNQIKTAALLHDVGKIIISKSLLMKKGKLTDEEYEIMKQHPEIGYRIISSLHGMEEIAHIILCHHERWDGNGYPNKISQNNIPFASRIITIVDAFDAMTSNRLYREKVSVLEALKELKKCAGTQFDPKLVTIFISHINEIVSSE